jgi:hypothetical protein
MTFAVAYHLRGRPAICLQTDSQTDEEVANAMPPDECPDGLQRYRDPAVVQS